MKTFFKDGVFYNKEFDDGYYSKNSAIGESKFVFESALDEIWDKKDSLIVAEAGFGVGINFLNLCKKFKNSNKFLHFVSIEKFPLSKKKLKKFYNEFNEFDDDFKKLSKKLIKKYPPKKTGLYRIIFSKNIILDLYFDDIKIALKNLDFEADVWFMDGFSPAKNPDMWDLEVMKGVASLSKIGTILATYSSSGFVKRNFTEAGFEVSLIKGHAQKRQMIRAVLKQNLNPNNNEIWFKRVLKTYNKNAKVLIIGAGISGLATAKVFQNAGFDVVITEKESEVATNGSGNLIGALMPLITQKDVILGKMHYAAFLMAVNFYKKYGKNLVKFSGAKEFAFDETLIKRYENSNFKLDKKDFPYPSIYIKNAASIRPKKLCKALSNEFNILFNYEFQNLEKCDNKYKVHFKNGDIMEADIVIFTIGSHSEELFNKGENPKINFDDNVQISSVRGQVTWIKKRLNNEFSLSARGYICPPVGKIQLIGATYDRLDYEKKKRYIDDVKNLENICEFIGSKKTKILDSNVGFRSYSGDRLPIIGALHDKEFFIKNYKAINFTKHSDIYPKHLDGVFINAAHGARGLGTSIMGAYILLDLVLNRPLCVSKEIFNSLNPARFLIRKLKKGLI
ncbi:bifunctional tRNA (5-methylaminomethyl-2-thiouridine)(34)-methyltransferase MnmD/FAD-dependent 5-carboxymethylaminomethyl-2-thiouridine(34) oxidoreductase MnmC [Campylobacter ureolyticus]|uniref:bifunctional tRNA (5-methylaminomethyl-2-thiouridine)(34)-methyltransferase MnmD/FAD-dependent 5-carboxymethylaminomethyl-2-thiouridine(34) oxidoreductase MnmC n=1 Tax=Campylobacter ureolyticus TaxID=827 RepID=UPI00288A155B|nr:bifunctional tRNA (5-methylaminomethyl-2-thiouridine)(34)-methyltransferase MnmD/FAD-dependent 5-carboxymethylaminomethyl-2-thiouridine(34) oxidoreductase MnmC [Campylobacter ureolyticus]